MAIIDCLWLLFEREIGARTQTHSIGHLGLIQLQTLPQRLEIENGHHFVPEVVEAFPGEIQSLSVSKPTLEDVFIHRTGHRFWNEDAEPAKTGKNKTKKKPSKRS